MPRTSSIQDARDQSGAGLSRVDQQFAKERNISPLAGCLDVHMRRLFVSITLAIAATTSAATQDATPPFSAYLMNEARETALARSAAPESVTSGAGIHLLRVHGYELETPCRNGFHCLVQRSFTVPSSNAAEFYDPRVVAPICFAPDAAATVMQRDLLIAPLVARGMPLPEIRKAGPTPTRLAR